MRAAHIKDGIVVNLIEVERLDVLPGFDLVEAGGANIGDHWDGKRFSAAPPQPEPVPTVVSRFQARAAMLGSPSTDGSAENLLSQVDAAVEASGDPFVALAWSEAVEFRRDSATVQALAAAVGVSDAQLDELFRAAAKIVA